MGDELRSQLKIFDVFILRLSIENSPPLKVYSKSLNLA